ncbi:MAG: hypothetical protein KJN68_12810, partial [Bacteroidia bacterium]|nr:hypothetical protein [Bacteroidia bacterium]
QNGILLATRLTNNYNPNSGEHFLSILDPITGSMKTKRPTKIEGEIAGIVEFQNDVFYVSEDAVNFINKSTGQLHWKKGIRTNPELTAEKDGKIYLHDKRSGGLKVLDLQSKSLSDLNTNQLNF